MEATVSVDKVSGDKGKKTPQGFSITPLQKLLRGYEQAAKTPREKGTYFEELILTYLKNEPSYKDLYQDVWTYAHWAHKQGLGGQDTGIDLVAQTRGTKEVHAIQCKFYASDYRVRKSDIDSFFTASGKKPFTHRIIVTTTNNWTEPAEDALQNQQPPVSKIDLYDLENSQIDWSKYAPQGDVILKQRHDLRPHQKQAVEAVVKGFETAERGKLVMACGTGKTFTSLKIAQQIAGEGKRVLFLVPSLSLLSQTLTEWTQQSGVGLHSFAVCSDRDVGKKRKKDDDIVRTFVHELRYPATTNAQSLAQAMNKRYDKTHMSVVFSTYHSIDVLHKAQEDYGLEAFDLIVCDEAHRTTGATYEGEEESKFVRVHNNDFIKARKRLYMTATPRIYGEGAQVTALKDNVALYSMDDEALFGPVFFVITFSQAVHQGLLVDYKVIILTVDAQHISMKLQKLLAKDDNTLRVDDAGKIIGCWKALSKQDQKEALGDDDDPMKRALAFCQVIEAKMGQKTHKVGSKNIARMFQSVVEAYQHEMGHIEQGMPTLKCEVEHIDGSMNATEKEKHLAWLKQETQEDTCRILSNVRCLSEGVDVPALDAVLFLTPKNSQVDVVQSVGRIMRKSPGKKLGYVILPVVIPEGVSPSKAMDNNKTLNVVWQVLQALRSHDDHFDAGLNILEFTNKHKKIEVISVTNKLRAKKQPTGTNGDRSKGPFTGSQSNVIGAPEQTYVPEETSRQMEFEMGTMERALYPRIIKKCGNRHHWEDWAKDIAKIASMHISRIKAIVKDPKNTKESEAFKAFANELRDDLNDSISNEEVIEMLAQHMVTRPVFEALFEGYDFLGKNPVSKAMQKMLQILQEHNIDKEASTLQGFYYSIKMRAKGLEKVEHKQKIIIELYDKFFRNAFPKMAERLGLVYTPIEVVDFIIHSVNDVLKQEFNSTLGDKGVHIIDPFTGTGTFITRMLQSGLISKEQLPYKYKNEIHANELVLLAYYIASINIEAVYYSLVGGEYCPFEGICLTDTFQLYEKDDMISELLVDNSSRRAKQKKLDIRVIMGNPPYSVGQKSANDGNANLTYPHSDARLKETYVKNSTATNKNSLYDSYIRAIRWGSDRLKHSGVMAYVTNGGWIESNSMGGLRQCLAEEFSSIYIFNLRGDQRTRGEQSRREGGKIFGSGSRATIAITVFVKNPHGKSHGQIYYHDIGDYLSVDEKLKIITALKSIDGISQKNGWERITPDKHNDWLNQRDDRFDEFIEIGNKKDKTAVPLFENYSAGIGTSRDAWCYNASKQKLEKNIKGMLRVYNDELDRYQALGDKKLKKVEDFIDRDPHKIKWSSSLTSFFKNQIPLTFTGQLVTSAYRPFEKQWLYYDRRLNHRVGQMPHIFPEKDAKNFVICVSGVGSKSGFSCLMTNRIPCLDILEKSQCFPMTLYEPKKGQEVESKQATAQTDLFAVSKKDEATKHTGLDRYLPSKDISGDYDIKDGITNAGLAHFQKTYPSEKVTKEDIFYYVYGILHSEDYRQKFQDNLGKQLPRIPCVKTYDDFMDFVYKGKLLAWEHVYYDDTEKYPVTIEGNPQKPSDYYVTKMKFATKQGEKDKTTIIYNAHITIKDIPLEAYDYIIGGRSAIEWIMTRQMVKVDKKSGITNDANNYALETLDNPQYPLELLQKVIHVSMKTLRIVKTLPKINL